MPRLNAKKATKKTASVLKITCKPPNTMTSWRMLRNVGNENSKPIVNIRNTIPNSAMWSSKSWSMKSVRWR